MAKYKKLHDAITVDDLKTVKTLILQGADVNGIYQQETAFTWAAQCKHFKTANIIMSSNKFNANAGNQFDRTPLFMAAKLNRSECVRRLIEMGARVNDADIRGVTPLGACAWHDSHECAEILIQRGANIDQPDVVGQTPLYRACSNVSKNVARVLLNHSCDVNLPTCDRKTPMMAALPTVNSLNAGKTLTDMLSICEMLATNGCDMDAQDENGRTALHHTVESNDFHGMCFLSAHGCDLELKDNIGYTAFQTAILPRRPRYEMAKYLIHFGADGTSEMLNPNEQDSPKILPIFLLVNWPPTRLVHEHVRWMRTELLLLFKHILNTNTINSHYRIIEPYHMRHPYLTLDIHQKTETEIVNFIRKRNTPHSLKHHTRLKIREAMGNKNLIAGIESLPIYRSMKTYLNLGLSTSSESLESVSKLHVAIRDGLNDNVKMLLDRAISTSIMLKHKNAMALAIEVGNTEATMMIVRARLAENITVSKMRLNHGRDTPLHVAAKHGRSEIVREMLSLGCSIDIRNSRGATPLQEAFVEGQYEAIAILIEHGAAINIYGQRRVPIIHLAAASGSKEVVQLLIQKGWSVNDLDCWGNTPLHAAASKGMEYHFRQINLPSLYSDAASAILDRIQTNCTISLPLYTIKDTRHLETTEFLLELGANATAPNEFSQTPLMLAGDAHDTDIMKAILKRIS